MFVRHRLHILPLLIPALLLLGCAVNRAPENRWTALLGPELKAMGYRNWVVVADAAFPVYSRRGVRTLMIEGEIPEVVHGVVESLETVQNVTPRVHVAREMRHVSNNRAPGMDEYRRLLEQSLHGHPVREMDYQSLSLLLEESTKSFSVLVLKTRTALPYSSVFIELDTAYWDRESERELRESLEKKPAGGP